MVSPKTRSVIWGRGAGRCHFPSCNKTLIGDLVAGNEDANFGFIAHIVAETPTGPRGCPTRSPLLADEPSNLMLLCATHHKLIDVDEVEDYPEQRLLDIKAAHERRIEIVGEIAPDRASHVLRYGAKIGAHDSVLSFSRVRTAMLPDRYPADGRSIGIEIAGSATTDGEEAFWTAEPENLSRQFALHVASRITSREIAHLSVFALAPIPLLIKLGALLGDITPSDVFQLHREPSGWSWARNGQRLDFAVRRPDVLRPSVALKLSISGSISDDRITRVLGEDVSIWSVEVDAPHNDAMRHPEDLAAFRQVIRRLYDDIKSAHGQNAAINVFPALPVSCAVELGRVRMPKADLPLVVFDQAGEAGFVKRLDIR